MNVSPILYHFTKSPLSHCLLSFFPTNNFKSKDGMDVYYFYLLATTKEYSLLPTTSS